MELPLGHIFCARCVLKWREYEKLIKCGRRKKISDYLFDGVFETLVQQYVREKAFESISLSTKTEYPKLLRLLIIGHNMDKKAVLHSLDDLIYLNNCGRI